MSRIGPIDPSTMTEEMRREWAILTAWRAPRDGIVGGPYDPWLRSPELLHRLQGLGRFLWERTSLDRGLVEYLIALTSRHWRCNLEWRYHRERALEHGIAEDALLDLFDGRPPAGPQDLRIAHQIAHALVSGASIGDALYRAGREVFGERGLVEFSALVGYYSLVAFTLRLFEIEPEGERPFPRPPNAHGAEPWAG